MARPERFVFVCTNVRPPDNPKGSCKARGSQEVFDAFKAQVKARDLKGQIIVAPSGCLGPCVNGPTVAVFPDDVFYGRVQPHDVDEIIEGHLVRGQTVERLVLGDEAWD